MLNQEVSQLDVLDVPKWLNVAYRQTKEREGFGDFSVLKSPCGPSKARVSCNPDELWDTEWIVPHFCNSLGWYGQRASEPACSTVPLGHRGWISPSAKYCVLLPTKCFLSSSPPRTGGEEPDGEAGSQNRVAEAVWCPVGRRAFKSLKLLHWIRQPSNPEMT